MAQYNKKSKSLLNNNNALFETTLQSDIFGNIVHPPLQSAFGEAAITELSPAFQLDGLYGLDLSEFQLNSNLSGTQLIDSNGLMTVSSGDSAGAFATLRSKRSVRYRPGQGSIARFTAMFPNGQVDGYQQVAGFINQSDILGVGYNVLNNEFAVVRRQDSKGEVAKFTITAPATGSETVTILLDSDEYTIPVTSGTIAHNTAELGNATYNGWIVDYSNDVLRFLSDGPPVDLTGTFSISSDGNLAGTYTNLQNGSSPNDTWTYQSQFNIDKLDGTGPSGMTIDPSKLNVFQIDFRWLGAGRIRYSIEDPSTGNIFPFHIEQYSNRNIKPSLANPSMRIGYGVVNAAPGLNPGGTPVDVSVKGASMMGGIEGRVIRNTTTKSVRMNSGDNLAANTIHHLVTLKNNRFNESGKPNVLNQREVIVTGLAASATENGSSGAAINFLLYKNVDLSTNREYIVLDNSSDYSLTTATIDSDQNDKLIGTFAVAPGGQINEDITNLRVILSPLETVSVALVSTAQTNSEAAAINFEIE